MSVKLNANLSSKCCCMNDPVPVIRVHVMNFDDSFTTPAKRSAAPEMLDNHCQKSIQGHCGPEISEEINISKS